MKRERKRREKLWREMEGERMRREGAMGSVHSQETEIKHGPWSRRRGDRLREALSFMWAPALAGKGGTSGGYRGAQGEASSLAHLTSL